MTVTLLSEEDFNQANCTIALIFPKSLPLTIVNFVQLIIALISIPFIIWNVRRFYKKRGTLHANFLIVYTNAFIFYGLHAINIFVFHTLKAISYLTYKTPCDLFTVKWSCDLTKSICFICLLGFTLVHACMCIERTLATLFAKNYERMGKKIGLFLTFLSWTIPIVMNFTLQTASTEYFTDPGYMYDYCVSMGSAPGTLIVHFIMLGIDGVATIIDTLLLKFNEIKGKTLYKKFVGYDLSQRFQLTENFSTIKSILPVVITHSVLYTFYLICAVIIRIPVVTANVDEASRRTMFEAVYMLISIYILAMMLVLLKAPIGKKKIENQIHKKGNEAEVYFELMQTQFAGPSENKSTVKTLRKKAW